MPLIIDTPLEDIPYYIAYKNEWELSEDTCAEFEADIAEVAALTPECCEKRLSAVADTLGIRLTDMLEASTVTYNAIQATVSASKEVTTGVYETVDDKLPVIDEFSMPRGAIPTTYWLLYALHEGICLTDILPTYLLARAQCSRLNENVGVVSFQCCI